MIPILATEASTNFWSRITIPLAVLAVVLCIYFLLVSAVAISGSQNDHAEDAAPKEHVKRTYTEIVDKLPDSYWLKLENGVLYWSCPGSKVKACEFPHLKEDDTWLPQFGHPDCHFVSFVIIDENGPKAYIDSYYDQVGSLPEVINLRNGVVYDVSGIVQGQGEKVTVGEYTKTTGIITIMRTSGETINITE